MLVFDSINLTPVFLFILSFFYKFKYFINNSFISDHLIVYSSKNSVLINFWNISLKIFFENTKLFIYMIIQASSSNNTCHSKGMEKFTQNLNYHVWVLTFLCTCHECSVQLNNKCSLIYLERPSKQKKYLKRCISKDEILCSLVNCIPLIVAGTDISINILL